MKELTIGDLSVTTFLKFLEHEIKTTCKNNDSRQVSTIALTAIYNATVDTYNETKNNLTLKS